MFISKEPVTNSTTQGNVEVPYLLNAVAKFYIFILVVSGQTIRFPWPLPEPGLSLSNIGNSSSEKTGCLVSLCQESENLIALRSA